MLQQDKLALNAIRVLSIDAIQKANSGHPGIVLGATPMLYELYAHHMLVDPDHPNWLNRDRFVLSAGHGSMMLYSLLHMMGYGIGMEDLKQFRQWGSLTPGHPEYRHTPGVDATSGPLGQGVAMAVGMAMAEAHLAAVFNKPGYALFDHYTYCLAGDGCMMEGVASEAASFAGTQKLHKLIVLYDRNQITIEGSTDAAFAEDVGARYEAYGWDVSHVEDGEDIDAVGSAIEAAKGTDKPSLIIVKTQIGMHSPLAGQAKTHGSPLGEENIAAVKQALGWEYEPFCAPEEAYAHCKQAMQKGIAAHQRWHEMLEEYKTKYPELAGRYEEYMAEGTPKDLDWEQFYDYKEAKATRVCSGEAINRLAVLTPNLFGGSADLGPSNNTTIQGEGFFSPEDRSLRNIHFGIREFAMAAMCNGVALHGGLRPYCGTFLVFSDYMRHAIRLSALMKLPVGYVLTHDSIGVGEDGPTHEPIEQIASLRLIPGCYVFRPADYTETAAAYEFLLSQKGPVCMALSRQGLPYYEQTSREALKGGYILKDAEGSLDAIIIATGSEVELALKTAEEMAKDRVNVRVVSMPCVELFEEQSEAYQQQVLPKQCRARLVIEAGATQGWYQYAGTEGEVLGIDHFGASAPGKILFQEYGFTVENAVKLLERSILKTKEGVQ